MGKSFGEYDTFIGKAVNIRRFQVFRAVAAQPIRPERINRYKKQI